MKVALHWCRRDLRILDNTALHRATEENDRVWSIFILDPAILQSGYTGGPQVQFMVDCLQSLQKNLELLGGRLLIRHGKIEEELWRVLQETGANSLYFNRDYEPYARKRDEEIQRRFISKGITVKSFKDTVLLEPDEVLKADGTPYLVYTPYSKAWRNKGIRTVLLGKPIFKQPITDQHVTKIPTLAELGFTLSAQIPSGGEKAAQARLKSFCGGPLLHYKSQRDYPFLEGTSRLSMDLRFGTLSPKQIYVEVEKVRQEHPHSASEIDIFVNELIWREFYQTILWHCPHVAKGCFKPMYDQLAWENNERYFEAWCTGQTGFPIVDAAMRQLNQTGWMHNRLRMIVASFLTKDLLIDWKWGEKYFMQRLIDGELAANNGGWQWSAGTGTDAQPYFRIFNPNSQAQKFDPEGRFIEKYVPEANQFHYTAPIVDHSRQRLKALELFKQVRA